MPRFLLPSPPDAEGAVCIEGDDARHLSGPLRARVGESVDLCLPGRWLTGVVERVSKSAVALRVVSDCAAPDETPGPTLCVALPAREAWEWTIEKATELGVGRLQPVLTERSAVFRDRDGAADRVARWERIAEEARKQCGRTRSPSVSLPAALARVLAEPWEALLMLDAAGNASLPTLAPGLVGQGLGLLVGPEGGLTTQECERAIAAGARPWSLGAFTLRVETAATAALALLAGASERNSAACEGSITE
jgi:16S rRNA (uracil1498-N3)-methyltransferase